MEVRQYIGVVRKWLWLIILGVILSSAISYLVSKEQPKIYQASTTLIVGTVTTSPNPEYSSILASQAVAKTYSRIVTSRPLLESAAQRLKVNDPSLPDQLMGAVSVETIRDTPIMILRVRGEDPEMAARSANAVAEELLSSAPASPQGELGGIMEFVQTQMDDLAVEISSLQKRSRELRDKQASASSTGLAGPAATAIADELVTLESKLRSAQERYGTLLTVRTGMQTNYVSVIERAEAPDSPISPNTRNNVLLAGLLGLVFALGIAFLIEYIDDTAKTPDLVSQIAEVPTLGLVSRLPQRELVLGPVSLRAPKSPVAESFRALRTSIQFSSPDKPLRSLMVTSADPGDGKTTVLANLAVTMAQTGLKVIAIDTDLRRPSLHKIFGLSNSIGLTSLLSGQAPEIASVLQSTDEPNLFIVASGPLPPNPSELLGSHRLQGIFRQIQAQADLVLFDSPPVLAVTDAVVLSTIVDGAVLVVDTARTRTGSLKQAADSIRNVGGPLLGVVLNKVGRDDGQYYYYNYYHYRYYSADEKRDSSHNGHSHWLGKLFNGKAPKAVVGTRREQP